MNSTTPELLIVGPSRSRQNVVLAHGAGAAMDSPFMNYFANGLAMHGIRVVRFEFPYMAERRQSGKRKSPDRPPVLLETWQVIVRDLGAKDLVIGGKSMGGRIASMVADDAGVRGVVCLGYPFHPVGKPQQLRIEHLQGINTPTLILQGQRDPFGREIEVSDYHLSHNVRVHWLPDGDHSFKPRKSSGLTLEQNLDDAIRVSAAFVKG